MQLDPYRQKRLEIASQLFPELVSLNHIASTGAKSVDVARHAVASADLLMQANLEFPIPEPTPAKPQPPLL